MIQVKKDEIEHFKRMLRDVPWHSSKIRSLQEDIEYQKYQLTGLASSSIPMTSEQEKSLLPMPHYSGGGKSLTERLYEIDQLKEQQEEHRRRIMECRAVEWLKWEHQLILLRVFILRENQDDLAAELNISRYALKRRIDQLISAIV